MTACPICSADLVVHMPGNVERYDCGTEHQWGADRRAVKLGDSCRRWSLELDGEDFGRVSLPSGLHLIAVAPALPTTSRTWPPPD